MDQGGWWVTVHVAAESQTSMHTQNKRGLYKTWKSGPMLGPYDSSAPMAFRDIHGASLIAQLVKNPPAMQETPVRFLGQEVPLEKGIGYPL